MSDSPPDRTPSRRSHPQSMAAPYEVEAREDSAFLPTIAWPGGASRPGESDRV